MNAVCSYDLTIPERVIETKDEVIALFELYCKHWAFQLEEGEGGYRHWQCRISLGVKKRLSEMKLWCKANCDGAHCSITSTTSKDNAFYVLKDETRVAGPWKSTDPKGLYTQRRFQGKITFNPWQVDFLGAISQTPDDRTINVIVETFGNKGKSFISMYCHTFGIGRRIPGQREARDIMRMVMDMPKSTCYIMDMPRATSKLAQEAIYAALEEIKNGYAYDDRYAFKEAMFEPPHIWIFTNSVPKSDLVSRDRWVYWKITDTGLEMITESEVKSLETASKTSD